MLAKGSPFPERSARRRATVTICVPTPLSKTRTPDLGYIVAARELVSELRLLRHAMLRHPSAFLQHAYALFLSLGHHESHARKVNLAMRERLEVAGSALRQYLPEFEFTPPQGGASIWVRAPAWVDGAELATMARSHGVLIEAGNVFFAQPPYPCPFFRMRFSSMPASQIAAGVQALGLAVDDLARARGAHRPVLRAPH